MELQHYLRIIGAHKWIVLATFLSTFCAVLLFTLGQAPTYQSTATYVVKTNLSQPDDRTLAAALDVLSRGQVGQTVAEVASSQVISAQAANELGLDGNQVQGITVNSRLLTGTNVVQVVVDAPYPDLARDFASAVGTDAAAYVQTLYGMYQLEMLDEPTSPVSSAASRSVLYLLLGAAAGILLGVVLAILSEYLQAPLESKALEPPNRTAEPAIETI